MLSIQMLAEYMYDKILLRLVRGEEDNHQEGGGDWDCLTKQPSQTLTSNSRQFLRIWLYLCESIHHLSIDDSIWLLLLAKWEGLLSWWLLIRIEWCLCMHYLKQQMYQWVQVPETEARRGNKMVRFKQVGGRTNMQEMSILQWWNITVAASRIWRKNGYQPVFHVFAMFVFNRIRSLSYYWVTMSVSSNSLQWLVCSCIANGKTYKDDGQSVMIWHYSHANLGLACWIESFKKGLVKSMWQALESKEKRWQMVKKHSPNLPLNKNLHAEVTLKVLDLSNTWWSIWKIA